MIHRSGRLRSPAYSIGCVLSRAMMTRRPCGSARRCHFWRAAAGSGNGAREHKRRGRREDQLRTAHNDERFRTSSPLPPVGHRGRYHHRPAEELVALPIRTARLKILYTSAKSTHSNVIILQFSAVSVLDSTLAFQPSGKSRQGGPSRPRRMIADERHRIASAGAESLITPSGADRQNHLELEP